MAYTVLDESMAFLFCRIHRFRNLAEGRYRVLRVVVHGVQAQAPKGKKQVALQGPQ